MTRERWQEKQKQKRILPFTGHTLDQHSFLYSSIERVGPLYIAEYVDRNEVKIHFTIYFKSGKEYMYSDDIEKSFTITTSDSFLDKLFGSTIKYIPREYQWYFDNSSEVKEIDKIRKEIENEMLRVGGYTL